MDICLTSNMESWEVSLCISTLWAKNWNIFHCTLGNSTCFYNLLKITNRLHKSVENLLSLRRKKKWSNCIGRCSKIIHAQKTYYVVLYNYNKQLSPNLILIISTKKSQVIFYSIDVSEFTPSSVYKLQRNYSS